MSAERTHWVYRIAWDGEPSMSGKPHVCSVAAEHLSIGVARNALQIVSRRGDKPNVRIEGRLVSDWVIVE